jgi:type II secretion system protein G
MLQKIRDLMKNDKGFTLIELIVVVVILGILAAIAIPRFMDRTDDAAAAQAAADTKIVQNAIDLYFVDNPGTADDALDVTAYGDDTDQDTADGYFAVLLGEDEDGDPIEDADVYLKAAPIPPVGYQYEISDGDFNAIPPDTD